MKHKLSCFIVFLIGVIACSTSQKVYEYNIKKPILINLSVRRPNYAAASSKAEFLDEDYTSHPLPNERFDCESLKSLMKEVQVSELRKCLLEMSARAKKPLTQAEIESGIEHPKSIQYRLRRVTQPYFELEENETYPACIKSTLPKLPVPREIFFQSTENGSLNCYNARIPLVADEFLGIRNFLHRDRLIISLPLAREPLSDETLFYLLSSWSLSVFIDPERLEIISHLVPDDICQKCMGKEFLTPSVDPVPPSWEL